MRVPWYFREFQDVPRRFQGISGLKWLHGRSMGFRQFSMGCMGVPKDFQKRLRGFHRTSEAFRTSQGSSKGFQKRSIRFHMGFQWFQGRSKNVPGGLRGAPGV